MNNETVHNYLIKERTDHTYDIYVDKKHIETKGSVSSAIKLLGEIMSIDAEKEASVEFHKDLILEQSGAVS